ncbi:MAG: hypothetical protein IPN90_02585 [Elusimicrobia bacterium]|nr:hypothetical protein [Elusimicrobiota bacterium]
MTGLKKIIVEVQEVCNLLEKTTLKRHAEWYKYRCKKLESGNLSPVEVDGTIQEIKKSLVGMGSFHDMPLAPAKGETMSASALREKQWELVERIGKAIADAKF